MKHFASSRFWKCLDALPPEVQALARRNYALLKLSPAHPSLHFKPLLGGRYFSVRVGLHYRAIGIPQEGDIQWFWIGSHAEYDKLIG